jgi:hypothetical protein
MRLIVDNLDILPVKTNFGEKEFVFRKNKNMPIIKNVKGQNDGFCETVWAGIIPLLLVVYSLYSDAK